MSPNTYTACQPKGATLLKSYTIINSRDTSAAAAGHVDVWPWDYAYKPTTEFRITHGDDRLYVSLRSYEENPVALIHQMNGPVCNDSCIEFFFSPSSDNSNGYFNFEVNSNPTFLLEYGPCTADDSHPVEWDISELNVRSTAESDACGPFWQVDFEMPYAMIRKYAPDCKLSSGAVIRGNVYKCGCTDQEPHYGCWNPVLTPGPNFHKPEFFGEFIIE